MISLQNAFGRYGSIVISVMTGTFGKDEYGVEPQPTV